MLDKLKDSWPIWLLTSGAIVFIVLAFVQQGEEPAQVSFKEIFPDEEVRDTPIPSSESTAINIPSPPSVEPIDQSSPTVLNKNTTLAGQPPIQNQVKVEPVKEPVIEAVVQSDPVSAPAIVAEPEKRQHGEFAVQVFSFQDRKRAESIVTNLKDSGYPAYILLSDLGNKGTWHRVRVGAFHTEGEAKKVLEQIKRDYQSGIIVRAQSN